MGRLSRRTRRAVAIWAAALAVMAFVGLTLRLFVFPDVNPPRRADAIVVLGGNGPAPRQTGIRLANEGYAPVIAFSINGADRCAPLAQAVHHARALCFRPHPSTTQGEARTLARLAAAGHWHRVIVVMQITQATRARLHVGWCFPGQVLEVTSNPDGLGGWVRGIAYEWGALLTTWFVPNTC
jgi:uncharacterized SAM-binding protein YcdF (DUF218 family)